jgi:hypothetical protein
MSQSTIERVTMSAKVAWSRLRDVLKKSAFYILVEKLDDEGNRVVEYMNRDGASFWNMDIDGRRPECGGQYFDTQSEAQAVLDQYETKNKGINV